MSKELKFREIGVLDAYDVYSFTSLMEVSSYTQASIDKTVNDTLNTIKHFHLKYEKRQAFPTFVIEYQSVVIGLIALHTKVYEGVYELGFELHPKYQNKGYMQKALSWLFNSYIVDLKIKKVCAEVLKSNYKSFYLLEKYGFKTISETNEILYMEKEIKHEKI